MSSTASAAPICPVQADKNDSVDSYTQHQEPAEGVTAAQGPAEGVTAAQGSAPTGFLWVDRVMEMQVRDWSVKPPHICRPAFSSETSGQANRHTGFLVLIRKATADPVASTMAS